MRNYLPARAFLSPPATLAVYYSLFVGGFPCSVFGWLKRGWWLFKATNYRLGWMNTYWNCWLCCRCLLQDLGIWGKSVFILLESYVSSVTLFGGGLIQTKTCWYLMVKILFSVGFWVVKYSFLPSKDSVSTWLLWTSIMQTGEISHLHYKKSNLYTRLGKARRVLFSLAV